MTKLQLHPNHEELWICQRFVADIVVCCTLPVLQQWETLTVCCLQAGEVGSGQGTTNRANTIKVSREKGFVVYMADSETEMVEWMSALEGAVSRLMRIIAGVEDEEQHQAPSHGGSSASNHNSMLAQAESAFKQRAQQQSWSEPQHQRPSYGVQGADLCYGNQC